LRKASTIGVIHCLIYSDCSSIPFCLSTPKPTLTPTEGITPQIRVMFGPIAIFFAEDLSSVFLFLLVIHFSTQPPTLATGINPFTRPKDVPVYIFVSLFNAKFLFRAR